MPQNPPPTRKEKIVPQSLVEEMKNSYLDYAMSVIVARALPDVRDGLKPVHRRILYAMWDIGLKSSAKFRKSATVVGEVLGKYHPHGDVAVYDSLVRLAQHFSMRYPLIHGQGNFGCFTGDTKVKVTDGSTLTFKQLIKDYKQGKTHYTYTFNPKTNEIEIAKIIKPRLTKKSVELIKITLDNGETIRCTLNHKFMMRDGSYKEARFLEIGNSLMPGYMRLSIKDKIQDLLISLSFPLNLSPSTIGKRESMQINTLEHIDSRFRGNDKKPIKCVSPKIIENASLYNHTIVAVELLKEKEDVYDLTIDETHNFLLDAGVFVHNSVDGDAAAAMRYTESKLEKITDEMLTDIDKETVGFKDNYDGSHKEPSVLPSKLPNLLLNGTLGIAVGMATNIPPHNLGELCDGIDCLIKNPESTVDDLIGFVKGPDFPTGGIIFDAQEIKRAYATGKGSIVMRGKCRITEINNGYGIIIDELPYQVNKAQLIEKIAELVKEGRIKGIRGLRDESDRVGMRISIDLKKDSFPKKVLNQLYKYTRLQDTFHVNMLALIDGIQPRVLSLKMVLEEFIKHRQIVIRKRTEYDLKNARGREHILIGLVHALENIDAIIETIKKSENRDSAKINLIKKFQLSVLQSEAILQMRLQALAGLERLKVEKELEEKRALIKELEGILQSPKRILSIIREETAAIKKAYGDERKTEVVKGGLGSFSEEDLIPKEATVIMITKDGYIKRISPQSFKSQGRGGKGVVAMSRKEEDTVLHMAGADTHDDLLFFTNSGKVFQLKAYEVPDASRIAKGNAVVNFLELDQNETVTALLPVNDSNAGSFYVMATQNGVIKKVSSSAFAKVRRSGLIAITIKNGDTLKWVKISNGKSHIMLTTQNGLAIRFKETQLREVGRGAQGVFGIKLKKKDFVVGMDVIDTEKKDDFVLTISLNGYGKMTNLKEYKVQSRAGKGIKTLKVTAKTGPLTSAEVISPTSLPEDAKGDLILISQLGQIIRIPLSSVPHLGRATQGVRLMRFKNPKDKIAQVAIV